LFTITGGLVSEVVVVAPTMVVAMVTYVGWHEKNV